MAAGALVVVGLVHALVVAPHYRVGSFDDDANYILVARALAAGAGLTSKINGFAPLVAVYPPGYGGLLAPLAVIWPHAVVPFRGLSLVCYLALFPLTWVYLGRRNLPPALGVVVLALLALNPVAATYATMVMAEMPFLVLLMVLLLVVERWEGQTATVTAAGIATVLLAASLIWIKEAGLGLAAGIVAWLVLRRMWRKAILAAAVPAALTLPLLFVRASVGTSLIGSRYSGEIGGPYPGGMIGRILHLAPFNLKTYFLYAVHSSIIPSNVSPLPLNGPASDAFTLLQWTAAPLLLVGFAVWVWRARDAACVAIPVYLLETLLFPYINERRLILVLPVILAWYALGAWTCLGLVVRAAAGGRRWLAAAGTSIPVAAAALALCALLPQFPRDYLFNYGQYSSAPAGSPYMHFLTAVARPREVVETSYLWTTTLLTGHPTANTAFTSCGPPLAGAALRRDNAAFVLSAALSQPGFPDGACLVPLLAGGPDVVRLYRTSRDLASVFEMIGPGTPHPDLVDLVSSSQLSSAGASVAQAPEAPQLDGDPAGTYPTVASVGGQAVFTWSWPSPRSVRQVSVGAAGGQARTTTSVAVEFLAADGGWHRVLAASGAVGPDETTKFLLASFFDPLTVSAVRVTVAAQGTAAVHDLHVLGPAA